MFGLRRVLGVLASFGLMVAVGSTASACLFCMEEKGPTLTEDMAEASMVLYGTFKEGRLGAGLDDGTTDFEIETILKSDAKSDPILKKLKNAKLITLPRYLPPTKSKFLVFIHVFKGNLDPYRGVETTNGGELVEYLKKAKEFKDKTTGERLENAFKYLNNGEFEVSMDAYHEFARADYNDYKDIAKKLPPDVIAGWLRDPKTPAFRFGLYASLLGHCGKAEHAKVLRDMLDDPEKRRGSGFDGLLAGYVMLEPQKGWSFLTNLLKDPAQEFYVRYGSLRTVRFLWEQRPDLVPQKDLVAGLALLLQQPDMADLAIEDLRRYKRWEMTGPVLSFFDKESHDRGVIRRSIMRFALRSPEKAGADFVQAQRKRDLEFVRETTELLDLEAQFAPPAPKEGSTKK